MKHKSLVRLLRALCIVEHEPALEILHSAGGMYPTYANLTHVRILWVVREGCDARMFIGVNVVNPNCLMPLVML